MVSASTIKSGAKPVISAGTDRIINNEEAVCSQAAADQPCGDPAHAFCAPLQPAFFIRPHCQHLSALKHGGMLASRQHCWRTREQHMLPEWREPGAEQRGVVWR
ncbi:unnamed protein product [Urochloa humidicola]